MEPRYPSVTVSLVGCDNNADEILGRVVQALRETGVSDEEIRRFVEEATDGDYDHLLQTVIKWVEVIS